MPIPPDFQQALSAVRTTAQWAHEAACEYCKGKPKGLEITEAVVAVCRNLWGLEIAGADGPVQSDEWKALGVYIKPFPMFISLGDLLSEKPIHCASTVEGTGEHWGDDPTAGPWAVLGTDRRDYIVRLVVEQMQLNTGLIEKIAHSVESRWKSTELEAGTPRSIMLPGKRRF